MPAWLQVLNFGLTVAGVICGLIWVSGRWSRQQEIDITTLEERINAVVDRVDRAGQKMSDIGDQLQVVVGLTFRVDQLEKICAEFPEIRDEVVAIRTTLDLRRQKRRMVDREGV